MYVEHEYTLVTDLLADIRLKNSVNKNIHIEERAIAVVDPRIKIYIPNEYSEFFIIHFMSTGYDL